MSTEQDSKPAIVSSPKKMSLWDFAAQMTSADMLIDFTEVEMEEFRARYLTKVDNVFSYRQFIEMLIAERKEIIARHKAELERVENYLEDFDERIANTMKHFGIEVLSGNEFEISWGKLNAAAIVPPRQPTLHEADDEATKPFVRKVVKTELSWDKDAIKKAHLQKTPCPIEGSGVDEYRNLKFDVKKGPRK